MKIILHKDFEKKYFKLSVFHKEKFKERRNLFIDNPFHPILKNHPLHGKYKGYFSINITADLRAIYKLLGSDTAFFINIDTHSNLYK